jgi:signal transduction histidine kinase
VAARLLSSGALDLTVEDDGRGLGGQQRTREGQQGVGLANTRARLSTMYGAGGSVVLTDRPGGGTLARLRFPALAAQS